MISKQVKILPICTNTMEIPPIWKCSFTLDFGCHCVLFIRFANFKFEAAEYILCTFIEKRAFPIHQIYILCKFIFWPSFYFMQIYILCKFFEGHTFQRQHCFLAKVFSWQKWAPQKIFPEFSAIPGQVDFHSNLFLCFSFWLYS